MDKLYKSIIEELDLGKNNCKNDNYSIYYKWREIMKKIKNLLMIVFISIITVTVMPTSAFAYTLTFNANGGTGTMDSRTDKTSYFLSTDVTNTYTPPEGKIFVGWSLNSNGSLIYDIDLSSENKTIYAIWKTPITEASATIISPVGGELPDIHPSSENSTMYSVGGEASQTDAKWSTSATNFIEFDKNNPFTTGTDYTIYIAFRANEGYCFTDNTILKLNGEEVTKIENTGNKLFIRAAKYTFTATEPVSYTYKYLEGDNQEFYKGQINSYNFKIDGDNRKFESLKIGDLSLTKDTDYTITKGSTIVTFTSEGISKLNALDIGEYNVETTFTNNTVLGKLIIKEEASATNDINDIEINPTTFDGITIYVLFSIISLITLMGCVLYIKRNN